MVEQRLRRVEPLCHGGPGVGGLHEAGMNRIGGVIAWIVYGGVASRAVEPDQPDLRAGAGVRRRAGALRAAPRGHVPGSRNAPLTLTLAGRPELRAVSVLDERCAGFFALGMAKASGRPVVVTCTSGTAAANLHPAVIEAWHARVPLIVLTADRPPELREVGAGQSIDQVELYGNAVKWFVEVGTHEPHRETAIHHRALACRAYWTAAGDRPGPVHLNFPLREPLAPEPEPLDAADWEGRAGRPPLDRAARARRRPARRRRPGAGRADRRRAARGDRVRPDLRADRRAGRAPGGRLRLAVARRADLRRALRPARPLPRGGPLRRAAARRAVRGGPRARPRAAGRRHAHLQAAARLGRRSRRRSCSTRTLPGTSRPGAPSCCCTARPRRPSTPSPPRSRSAHRRATRIGSPSWRAADAKVPPALAAAPADFEPKLLAALEPELPDGAIVWLSSSMPVRDVEACFPQSPKRLRFLANRGANGIDGVVSSAAGAALATGAPTWLLTGELALLHDIGRAARGAARRRRPARGLPRQRRRRRSSTSCRWPSTPTRRSTRSTSPRRWTSTSRR